MSEKRALRDDPNFLLFLLLLDLQGYLAHKKPPPPLKTAKEPRRGPTAGTYGVVVSGGTPVGSRLEMRSSKSLWCRVMSLRFGSHRC